MPPQPLIDARTKIQPNLRNVSMAVYPAELAGRGCRRMGRVAHGRVRPASGRSLVNYGVLSGRAFVRRECESARPKMLSDRLGRCESKCEKKVITGTERRGGRPTSRPNRYTLARKTISR